MWRPLHLDYVLSSYNPFDWRVLGTLIVWIVTVFGAIWVSLYYLPEDWVTLQGNRNSLIKFFIINPSMLIGLILLFWFGFEWSFIPVFLSMFIIGFFSYLPFYWAILFALSFVFSLTIYALVYHCINVRYDLRSLSSLLVFIVTSFVASTAGSLGSFIWSLAHDLSATETANLWNGWWSGSFLQSLLIVAPMLYLFSPTIETYKSRWFVMNEHDEVSTMWVYLAVILTTAVIAVFILSGDYLAKQKLAESLLNLDVQTRESIMASVDSFDIITRVSIWIIICVGLGGIFLIGSWNTELKKKVKERTIQLEKAEGKLKASLGEKVVLLQEIHHRVKNNLAVVIALLDLQYMRSDDDRIKHILSDSKARIKSMAFVHETLYQTENFSKIELKAYLKRLSDSITNTFRKSNKEIELVLDIEDLNLEMSRAVPLGLIINELVVNAYKHAFKEQETGKICVSLFKKGDEIELHVTDNGMGIGDEEEILKKKTLGMTLIKTLSRQIKASFEVTSKKGDTDFTISLNQKMPPAA